MRVNYKLKTQMLMKFGSQLEFAYRAGISEFCPLHGDKLKTISSNGTRAIQKKTNSKPLTRATFRKTDVGKDLVRCKNVDESFSGMGP